MTSAAPVDLLQDVMRFDVPVPPAEDAGPAPTPTKAPSGETCARCKDRPGTQRCYQCERWVCRDDHWIMLGLCKDCATPGDNQAARETSRAPPDLGIKWIEE